jgi:hypothetical protein
MEGNVECGLFTSVRMMFLILSAMKWSRLENVNSMLSRVGWKLEHVI